LERAVQTITVPRRHIEFVAERPFDVGAFRRFGLYLLVPVGSWVAGAPVERIVDAALKQRAPMHSPPDAQHHQPRSDSQPCYRCPRPKYSNSFDGAYPFVWVVRLTP
jgi:hypothetical protein